MASHEAWSTDDQPLRYAVRLGLWTNWSRGSVLGQTLTITRGDADLLIAFTAFFIAFVGSRFWRILCVVVHRSYSTTQSRDAVHHQRQIILRNTDSPDTGLLNLVQLLWAWRDATVLLRCLPVLLMAILCISAYTAAGGFSSQITSSVGDEVLLDGSDCGSLDSLTVGDDVLFEHRALEATQAANALNYAQQCYTPDSSGLMGCRSYTVERLPTQVDYAAGCPFDDSICRTNYSNIFLDTGYLDSHIHLGVNAPKEQRFFLRKTSHCAPLVTEGYTATDGNSTSYNYGGLSVGGKTWNYTFTTKSVELQYQKGDGEPLSGDYKIYVLPDEVFAVDPKLRRSDANIEIIFLAGGGVVFQAPADDDWYRATTAFSTFKLVGEPNTTYTSYRADEAASPLACAHQFQVCISDTETCGPLANQSQAVIDAFGLLGVGSKEVKEDTLDKTNNPTNSRLDWLLGIGSGMPSMNRILQQAGPHALASRRTYSAGLQGAMAADQWKQDMQFVWAASLARMQADYVQTAHGRYSQNLSEMAIRPQSGFAQDMCDNQKIRTTKYASFNFFALLFTYIIGSVITVISFALEPILEFLQQNYGFKRYAQLEWTANATLQLHRLIHDEEWAEEGGVKTWSRCVEAVPVTRPGHLLKGLDMESREHPRLCKQHTATTTSSSTQCEETKLEKTVAVSETPRNSET